MARAEPAEVTNGSRRCDGEPRRLATGFSGGATARSRAGSRKRDQNGGPDLINGVVGVIIWTEDLVRLLTFYRDTLGLTPHSVRPEFVSFKWGDMRLGLGVHSEVKGPAKEPNRIMVNFGVEDVHEEFETLSGRGVRFIRPPEREHWGGWVSTFADPDGNLIQLMQLEG